MTNASPSPLNQMAQLTSATIATIGAALSPAMEAILEARGITSETASRLGWHSCARQGKEWLAMPAFRNGRIVGTKYRTFGAEKAFSQDKGSEQCFWNLEAMAAASVERIVICEGEMDMAIALQCGILAVSVPNGAPSKQIDGDGAKYVYLDDVPDDAAEIILAFDGDEPGANLLHDVSIRLGQHRCKWVQYPKGCKDLNEAFLAYGERGVHETINRAKPVRIEGVYRMSEIAPPPFRPAVPCPIAGMADYYSLRAGDLAVLTGVPGMGKTTFLNELTGSMAKEHGWNILIASFEQNPKVDHLRNLRTYYNGALVIHQTEKDIAEADEWIEQRFSFIIPRRDEDADIRWLIKKIRSAVLRYECHMVVIDPWNEIEHVRPNGMSLTEYVGHSIKALKGLADELNVHMVIAAHPAKMHRGQDGKYPIPSLYDISDSAHWYNKPDIGIVIHREEEGSIVRISKCRYTGTIGQMGEIKLELNMNANRFTKRY